jgi:hypothetical protein
VKRLIGFALGTLLSLGAVTSASAAGTNIAAPAHVTDDGVEVIVVTAKRPAAQPIAAASAIYEVVVTAKRAAKAEADRTPPAMAIEMPKLELARAEAPVFRL